jgi:hypothetical protein
MPFRSSSSTKTFEELLLDVLLHLSGVGFCASRRDAWHLDVVNATLSITTQRQSEQPRTCDLSTKIDFENM